MVKKGIVLGHKVLAQGLEVDIAKVVSIEKLPPSTILKSIRSFLVYVGFYIRFIKDFSKISKPLCGLLEKEAKFIFIEDCLKAFEKLKSALTTTPVLITPNWTKSFILMCDASNWAVGIALG